MATSMHNVVVAATSSTSDPFPEFIDPPVIADFPATLSAHYCHPTGSNTTGDGTIDNPWQDLIGASDGGAGSPVAAGAIIYFREGTYPGYTSSNFSYSDNRLTVAGTLANPIIMTNYPEEIAKWVYTNHWTYSLQQVHQKLIGIKVGSEYGIQITGGVSINFDDCRVSGVEIISGSYNGGDGNPSMLAIMVQDGTDSLHVSHCFFHDSKHPTAVSKMAGLRLFIHTNTLIEYNIFQDNNELTDAACIYSKDHGTDWIVRNNVFVNCKRGVAYFGQNNGGGRPTGVDIYNNLFVDTDNCINFRSGESGDDILVYNNVSISASNGFFLYNNASTSITESDRAQYYNNVIYSDAIEKGFLENADDMSNLPHLWKYNLYSVESDKNDPFTGTLTASYYENSIVSAGEITYNSSTQRVTIEDTFSGSNAGKDGNTIGGFVFSTIATSSEGIFFSGVGTITIS